MSDSLIHPILTLLMSFVITISAVPLFRRVAFKKNIMDYPSENDVKKIHKMAVPLLGGVSIFVGTVTALLVFAEKTSFLRDCFLLGSLLLLLGFLDDRKPLTYRPRLLVQVFAAIVLVFSMKITPFAHGSIYPAVFFSLLWIIGVTNAVNLMDNLDGAATGVACIVSASLAIVGFFQGNTTCLVYSAALLGACMAFLVFNYRPASIFLGDAGCLFIGFSLAVISLMEVMALHTTIYQYLAFPFFLGVPIFDTTFATVRRIAKGRAIYLADGSNLTYRFLEKGWDKNSVVLFQYSLQLLFCLVAFGLLYLGGSVAPFIILVGLVVPFLLSRYLA